MKNFKFANIAHLYLGCLIKTPHGVGHMDVFYRKCVNNPASVTSFDLVHADHLVKDIIPILHRFEDLTDEQLEEYSKTQIPDVPTPIFQIDAKSVSLLLSWHIDIFGLIESKQAIDFHIFSQSADAIGLEVKFNSYRTIPSCGTKNL